MLVIVESPYAPTEEQLKEANAVFNIKSPNLKHDPVYKKLVNKNLEYARQCCHWVFEQGGVPFASHLFYTQEGMLDDTNKDERNKGIEAGFFIGGFAEKVCVFYDKGISKGMKLGVQKALERDQEIEFVSLPNIENKKLHSQQEALEEFIDEPYYSQLLEKMAQQNIKQNDIDAVIKPEDGNGTNIINTAVDTIGEVVVGVAEIVFKALD